ncbi:MAG: TPM domain-containing protein, partial [Candidatus Omnitrophica bacterium]|nr:TPM domain-containing protein [Candidatus Omnitrophota bacterium]
LVALKERRVTIGVGQNLKGILPDSVINNIIQNTITPEFGKGRYSEGIKKGTETIVSILNEAEIPRGWPLFNKRNLLIVFIIMLVLFLARRYFSHPTPFPK